MPGIEWFMNMASFNPSSSGGRDRSGISKLFVFCLFLSVKFYWHLAMSVRSPLSVAASVLPLQSWVVSIGTPWPVKLNILTVWPFCRKGFGTPGGDAQYTYFTDKEAETGHVTCPVPHSVWFLSKVCRSQACAPVIHWELVQSLGEALSVGEGD